MEEQNSSAISLERADFIFRHPLIVLSVFLIAFNIFHAYATTIPAQYRASAVLSFETTEAAPFKRNIISEKKDAAEKIIVGKNIDTILEAVLKNAVPKERAREYASLGSALYNPKSGIRFLWEPRETSYLLTISFSYRDPRICYRTVQAVVDLAIRESQQKTAREMETNLSFLRDQVKFYKDKIDAIGADIEATKTDLIKRFPELSAEEKELIASSSGSIDITKEGAVQKFAMFEEVLTGLRNDLAGVQSRRDELQKSLDSGTAFYNLTETNQEDPLVAEYTKAIASKELEVATLTARGFKDEHPQVRQLRQEADQLRVIRKNRMSQMLRVSEPGTPEYEDAVSKTKFEIEELDLKVALLKKKVQAVQGSRDNATTQLKSRTAEESDIKSKVAKLVSLKRERDISETYFVDMNKKLTDAELKYRGAKEAVDFKIAVLQEPKMPGQPDSSKASGIVLRGLIAAVFLGIGCAYITDKLKDAVHSGAEAAALLGIPTLVAIERITTAQETASGRRRLKYSAAATVGIMILSRIVIALVFSARA